MSATTCCLFIAATGAVSLVLAGCGSTARDTVPVAQAAPAPSTAGAAEDRSASPPAAGPGAEVTPRQAIVAPTAAIPEVLKFRGNTLGGKPFSGADLAGQDVVFWFWAPDCSDCVREAPHVLAATALYGKQVTFVGVPGLAQESAMRASVKHLRIGGFTQVADVDGKIWKRFGVVAQPAYAFVDSHGKVTVVRGALGAKGMNARVAALTVG